MNVRTLVIALATLLLLTALPASAASASDGVVPLERPAGPIDIAGALDSAPSTQADIVNGIPSVLGTHPYVALLLFFDPQTGTAVSACTGSLIASRYVLTAQHCVADLLPVAAVLDMSSLDDIDRAEVIFADGVYLGPHTPEFATSDIALLHLEAPAVTAPVTIAGPGDDFAFTGGTPATIVGWGLTDGTGATTDDLLQAEIDLLAADACYTAMGELFDHVGMLCGGGLASDACMGDSGGPLLVWDDGWVVLGVTSFGDADCLTGDATTFARVTHARSWISTVVPDLPDRPGRGPFVDVTSGQRHLDAILAVSRDGVAAGYADGTFRPARNVTRAQMASFLTRALSLPTTNAATRFSDVPADHEHAAAIAAVADAGITTGYGDGTFEPSEPLDREQMATFLARGFDLTSSGPSLLVDVLGDSVHAPAIAAVAEAGISTGYPDGTFRPRRHVTRAQMASFLARALDLLALTPSR